MLKIAVLISGGGSNLQSIIDNVNSGKINGNIEMVISDSENAYGIERAKQFHIKTYVINKNKYGKNICDEILKITKGNVDLIVLAGFLSILKGDILKEFKNRIINIHPSLIPSFCGKGMYGIKVHEAVIESGVKVSGCTVHFVNEKIDHGAILLQEVVPVYFEDTKESLQKRVLEKEHILLPKAISLISEGRVKIVHGHGKID